MSTWQIFSDVGNDFRWEVSGRIIHSKAVDELDSAPINPHNSSAPRLPSMADLLLQGCSKILENEGGGGGNAPMFRTGSGKSVVLKQSSIAKALSVLDDDGAIDSACFTDKICDTRGSSNSLFQTGSGKSVDISSAGLLRAKKLLGLEEANDHSSFQSLQKPMMSSAAHVGYTRQKLSHPEIKVVSENSGADVVATSVPMAATSTIKSGLVVGSKFTNEVSPSLYEFEFKNGAPRPPSIKFHTAGGRSLSVSSDALERAKSLLGDPDLGTFFNEGNMVNPVLSAEKGSICDDAPSNKEKDFHSSFTHPGASKNKYISKSFISPLRSSISQDWTSFNSKSNVSGNSLMKKFDEVKVDSAFRLNSNIPSAEKPICSGTSGPAKIANDAKENGTSLKINPVARSSRGPLVDISNTFGVDDSNSRQTNDKKRKHGKGNSISPFKRPRSSRLTIPLHKNFSFVPNGISSLPTENFGCRRTVSARYPFRVPRMYIKEYFGVPLTAKSMLEHHTEMVIRIKPDTAAKYMFHDESGLNGIGVEAFYQLLAQCGASVQHASKEWVMNHYKWIVWKLACYEIRYPMKPVAKFLTVSNVLEELKYRYEREANHGHRSAIKRILEGDALPSSMLVLCISAIDIGRESNIGARPLALDGAEISEIAKVELTDGWYSVDALLDVLLTKHLAAGKLFVGQKLRIWGAGLCGWVGPVSPLESSKTVFLSLHINGTYRAHWADRLGFCKVVGTPLAFRCIKSKGGPVPRTLVGVTRVYPILYKEKLSNGGSIVRSEGMEAKMMQLYNQRCSGVVEGVISECQGRIKGPHNDSDSEDGAKILKLLETAAEPEVLLAEMSSEQLSSFASYQAKQEALRLSDMEKAIEKALRDADLGKREVAPFMRVRVVGLTDGQKKVIPKEGLITIWNPTEKQQSELLEGQAYIVEGLLPVKSDSNMLYLQARGSTAKWQPLSSFEMQRFQPFFNPRASASLSNLGEVPPCSEFDIAAFVVYVGELYMAEQRKKQWVFVTDNSISMLQSEDISNSLLAISFCSPCMDKDGSSPVNSNLMGSTVGFFNLIKRAKDQINHLWIAEATENSTYSLSFGSQSCSHLKNAAASMQSWAKISSSIVDKLKEKILFITGDYRVKVEGANLN